METFTITTKYYREHYQRFMSYLQTVGYSQASRQTFDTAIREFLHWLETQKVMSLERVKENDIEKFYTYQQERPTKTGGTLSESRIGIHMYVIKLFFAHLQESAQLDVNPMNDLYYAHAFKSQRENILSREDIQRLYQACTTAKARAILGLFYGCGLRRKEVLKLDARDIHFRSGLLYVREGKGGRKRTIPLSKTVLADLKEYYYTQRPTETSGSNPDSLAAFMLNRQGKRMREWSYNGEIKKLLVATGLNAPITMHHFRHAIATHLLESGMKTEQVKDFLGHASIETTQTYTHITTTQMKKTTAYGLAAIPA
jgi:integrase/recombinase XerD